MHSLVRVGSKVEPLRVFFSLSSSHKQPLAATSSHDSNYLFRESLLLVKLKPDFSVQHRQYRCMILQNVYEDSNKDTNMAQDAQAVLSKFAYAHLQTQLASATVRYKIVNAVLASVELVSQWVKVLAVQTLDTNKTFPLTSFDKVSLSDVHAITEKSAEVTSGVSACDEDATFGKICKQYPVRKHPPPNLRSDHRFLHDVAGFTVVMLLNTNVMDTLCSVFERPSV